MERNNFKYLLGVDFETTGVCMGQENPVFNVKTGERHQAVSGGFLVIDGETLEIVDELYVEIKWNDESFNQLEMNDNFGSFAEKIHGLSLEYLENSGVFEEEAVEQIANLIVKYWGTDSPISMLGHNVQFDRYFLRDLLERYDLPFKYSQRNVDSFTLGFTNWRAYDSDELFSITSGTERTDHNALEDIKLTLQAVRVTRNLFEEMLDNK